MNEEYLSVDYVKADDLWCSIVEHFREVCLLKQKGDKVKAREILQTRLVDLMRLWCLRNGRDRSANFATLASMFVNERKRIEDASLACDLLSAHLTKNLLPVMCNSVTRQVGEVLRAQAMRPIEGMTVAAHGEEPRTGKTTSEPWKHSTKPRIPFDDIASAIDSIIREHQLEEVGQTV
jgi:hypothetical protein